MFILASSLNYLNFFLNSFQDKINQNFNAEKWMKEISKIFKAQSSAPKGQNPEEVCNMKARKIVPSVFEAQLESAIQNANKFVEEFL